VEEVNPLIIGRLPLRGKEPGISTGTHTQQYVEMTLKPLLKSENDKSTPEPEQRLTVNQVCDMFAPLKGWYETRLILLVYTFFISCSFLYYNFAFFLLNPHQDKVYRCLPKDQNLTPFNCTMQDDICLDTEGFIGTYEKYPDDDGGSGSWVL
jgi:hypothetical protein